MFKAMKVTGTINESKGSIPLVLEVLIGHKEKGEGHKPWYIVLQVWVKHRLINVIDKHTEPCHHHLE
jgi:hypothetical protein